ncbi:MAG TPA: DUF2891 domain-containing protein [Candidatus Krumholzibacterium sp.]|nr:DUF2891 domain-containing protein [Candidatus Krumholzibacterium sp.]
MGSLMHVSMWRISLLFLSAVLVISSPATAVTRESGPDLQGLDVEAASSFARIALACVHREFPNKDGHVALGPDDVLSPSVLHPAFYGCFDWHSSVHGHWMLLRILKTFPELPEAGEVLKALSASLTKENLEAEAEYFRQQGRGSFERTYGWAWLLKLAEELELSTLPEAERWREDIAPVVSEIRRLYVDFLPRQTYPIRRGVHPNTAFGISFALDYARTTGDGEFEDILTARARDYYLGDTGCPGGWEPDGDDFFSPCLMEADLVRRILGGEEFARWLSRFLPDLDEGGPAGLLEPAEVSDRSDPKIVHLDGLNLTRAWCMLSIAGALPEGDDRAAKLRKSASLHAAATLGHIASGNYEGEHWLASFAVYLLTSGGTERRAD